LSRTFDTIAIVDWSAAATPSPVRQSANAIWIGVARRDGEEARYLRTRSAAEAELHRLIAAERNAGRRLLVGFDFPFGYPMGFARLLTGRSGAVHVMEWLSRHLSDAPDNANNRFALANDINRRLGGAGPFWGRPQRAMLPDLPERKHVDYLSLGFEERRQVEKTVPRAQPVWKLFTTGSVGGQTLTGLPVIHRLAKSLGAAIWPFDPPDGPLVFCEVYPSLIDAEVRRLAVKNDIKDEVQVRLLARAMHRLSGDGALTTLLDDVPDWPGRADEGWILGAGHSETLSRALA
jgi:molybdopterin-guanine dinucleotide biosynthesis protein B